MNALQVKICGITQPEQGQAIARLGATALGFICVERSPRYVTPERIRAIVDALDDTEIPVKRVGVFVDASLEAIAQVVDAGNLNTVQLHGEESPDFCRQLRQRLPGVGVIKALRVRSIECLQSLSPYHAVVDAFLLDAYHPDAHGGTGITLDWSALHAYCPERPWFLAGGLNPDNILQALALVQPSGIDLSSGLERSPGDKDLERVAQLFSRLNAYSSLNQTRNAIPI